jgi:hypothetical protein
MSKYNEEEFLDELNESEEVDDQENLDEELDFSENRFRRDENFESFDGDEL